MARPARNAGGAGRQPSGRLTSAFIIPESVEVRNLDAMPGPRRHIGCVCPRRYGGSGARARRLFRLEVRAWRGEFYPVDMPRARWFEHYAATFDTVEINNTFYRLPEASTFAAWGARAPVRFLYAVKASRFLTHMKKLKDPDEPMARLFSPDPSARPPSGPRPLPAAAWLAAGPRAAGAVPASTATRHPTRHGISRSELVLRRGVAPARASPHGALPARQARSATVRERIGPFVYVRFHGATGAYGGGYPDERLAD